VIGITLLSMITATLFAIIRGSMRGASEIEQLQRESDSVNRFIELNRKAFSSLPATATLSLKLVQNTEPVIQELTVAGSPDCFPFGMNPITLKDTILRLRPHPDGLVDDNNMPLHYLSISREDLIPQTDDSRRASGRTRPACMRPMRKGATGCRCCQTWCPSSGGFTSRKSRRGMKNGANLHGQTSSKGCSCSKTARSRSAWFTLLP
jgi:hypothetical protein